MAPSMRIVDLTVSSDDQPPSKRTKTARSSTQSTKHVIDLISSSDEESGKHDQSSKNVTSKSSTPQRSRETGRFERNPAQAPTPAALERSFHGSTSRNSTSRVAIKQPSLPGSLPGLSQRQKPPAFAPRPGSGSPQVKHSASSPAARLSSDSPPIDRLAPNPFTIQKANSPRVKHPRSSFAAKLCSNSREFEQAVRGEATEPIRKRSQSRKAPSSTAGTTGTILHHRQSPKDTGNSQNSTQLEPSSYTSQDVQNMTLQNHRPASDKSSTPVFHFQAPVEESQQTSQNAASTPRRFPHPSKPLSKYLPNARKAFEMSPTHQRSENTASINAHSPVVNVNQEARNLLKKIELEKARESIFTLPANGNSGADNALHSRINTDSPILPHVHRNKGKQNTKEMLSDVTSSAFKQTSAHKPMPSVPTLDELKELLGELDQEMKENHAATVNVLLEKARKYNKEVNRKFDDVSPFASLKSVELETGQRPPNGARSINMDTFTANSTAKFTRQRSKFFSYSFGTEVERVPRYHALTIVRRNILTADNEKLRFIPYLENDEGLGAPGKRIERDLLSAYKDTTQNEPPVKVEKLKQLYLQMDWWLQNLPMPCSRRDLEQYLLAQDIKGKKYQLGLLKSYGHPLKAELKELASRFAEAFEQFFNIRLRDQRSHKVIIHKIPLRDVILSPARLKELVDLRKTSRTSIDSIHDPSPIVALETYVTLGCLICSAIDCQTHGEYNPERPNEAEEDRRHSQGEDETRYLTVPQRLTMQPDALLRKYHERLSLYTEESNHDDSLPKPCSHDCRYRSHPQPSTGEKLSTQNVNDIRLLMITIRSKRRQSCDISRALELPCWKVFIEVQKCEKEGGVDLKIKPAVSSTKAKRPDWYDNRRKKLLGDWQNVTECHLPESMAQTFPCIHAGPCDQDCYCVHENILCESFCSCSHDCPRRFTGCGCQTMTGKCCVADTCTCIQLNRECGPQCGSCGALERLDPLNKYKDELFETGCQNVCIQRGVSKHLIVGESQLAGFGCYTAEAIKKGDFVSEYRGEVISNGEAERRGIIYDRLFLSFLFNLNNEYVIDAARFGNKTRFINHADCTQNGLNCEARIYFVNGEHRIKFISLRDINVGEELLFNYGKKFAEKHGLDKKLPKVKESTKKGVVTGAEALDMLDGMDDRKHTTRGKMFAMRGGRGGRGMGKHAQHKARKSAPKFAEEQQEAGVGADEVMLDAAVASTVLELAEDDYLDDGQGSERPVRKRARPSKYTR